MSKKWSIVAIVAVLAALVVTACQPQVVEKTVVVTVPGEAKEVVVTATPEPAPKKLTDEEKQALIDGVAAKALDDYTLQVTFTTPAIYNLNIIGMWVAHAMPKWLIEERGDRWTETGFNQSYGPYALKEWVHDAYITIVKNPFWPGIESSPQASIEEIKFTMLDASPAFAEYEAGNLDVAGVPLPDIDRVKADPVLSKELVIGPMACTYYYGFNTSKPPTDNVHMRRALSLAIDRQGLIDNVTKGGQEPAQWFCRPGMAGCPTMQSHPDLGVKYDPEKARAELKAYMDEMGFTDVSQIPEIILMFNTSEGHKRIAEAIAQMWKEVLGIQVTVTNQEWKVYLKTLQEDSPNVWRLGWCMDYPDANNWTREVFAIGGHEENATQWRNEEFTKLLEQAALEKDYAKRQDMYAQAEQILVWEDAAIAPIYWYTRVTCTKPYVNRTFSQHGHEMMEKWSLAEGRNTLRVNLGPGDVPTLDPALATDTSSVQVIDMLTVGLTRLDEVTLELLPGMAERWEVSEDGLTYTFYLRQGIPWVRWDGTKVVQVLDDEGNPRYVTAHDFEYGIKRTCNPDTASDYAYVLGFAVKGCNELLNAEGW